MSYGGMGGMQQGGFDGMGCGRGMRAFSAYEGAGMDLTLMGDVAEDSHMVITD